MTPPKVFISYSHDSHSHEDKVLALANRLRGDGIDAVLDQYESFPPRGWIDWMRRQIRDTQFILVVCTNTYRRRWNGDEEAGVGLGATYETQFIQQLLYDAGGVNERFVPVLLDKGDGQHLPVELRKYTYFSLYTESGYEALYRLLTHQAKTQRPILEEALPIPEAKADFRNVAWNAPPRNPFFTGRTTHLSAIRRALTQTAVAALTQPQTISGLGGIGKTQTAIEYAHLYRADYAAVFWSGADSRDALLSGFAALAGLLDLPQKNEQDLPIVAAAVRRWLESNSGWLLVLDNVEDLPLLRQFAPARSEGHLLITTRLQATGEFAESIEMNKMAPDEGALFLLRRSKAIAKNQFLNAVRENDRAVAQEICRKMDCLPLALDQAGAFIEEAPCTPTEYLALYSSHGEALRARRGKLAGDHPSVSVTFSMAFTRLLDTNTAAAELVRACAFLAPDAIPEEVFTAAGREWGEPLAEIVTKPLGWIETIEEAGRFSLIRRHAELKNLQIHRVVQEVIKDGMSEQARRSLAERAVHALNRVFPKAEFENWPQCQRLISHSRMAASLIEEFNIYSAVAARLLNDSVFYLVERGEYAEAEPVYRRVIAMRETLLGPEHPDTVQTLNALAVVYHHQGRYSEAEPLYHRVLTTREKVLGPEHPDTAQTLNNLAGLYHQQGLYAEAEPLYYRCLALRERALGSEHPDTAQSAHNLALLRQNQGRHTEAEQLYRRALSIFQGAHGLDHPDVATALNNLGELYRIQGLYNDAELLLHRALAVREKVLGSEHPYAALTLIHLAELYCNQVRYPEAELLFGRALAVREKVLGPDHPDTISTIRNYAELLRKLGKDGEAEKLEARGQQEGR